MKRSRKYSPEEKLKRKLRKRVKNQSAFLKHIAIYFVLFTFFIIAAFVIQARDFIISFLILFSFWMIGLIFHWLSAFVFNRIDSWEETQYQRRLKALGVKEPQDDLDLKEEEENLDLKTYNELRNTMEKRWNEGDFV